MNRLNLIQSRHTDLIRIWSVLGCLAALCGAGLLLAATSTSAAVRFATPGGTAPAASDCLQTAPCSLFNAASRLATNTELAPGDEIVVEPGTYSDIAGDLGPGNIALEGETTIHGAAGKPRPIITLSSVGGSPGFLINREGVTLSDVEIVSTGGQAGFLLAGESTVERVVSRTSSSMVAACAQQEGLIRDSACLAGADGIALEISDSFRSVTARLRNVTAIATGPGSFGISVRSIGPNDLSVDAVGVLARGGDEDVLASAFSLSPHTPGTGPTVTVDFDHSDFANVRAEDNAAAGGGAIATVSVPGAATNITAAPVLAADGYHQLPGSPTIDAGATDASSGTTDVDGEQRVFGAGTDIGADELHPAPPPAGDPTAPAGAPNTTLTRKPRRRTSRRQATFVFVSNQAGARFECKIDKRSFRPCRSPLKVTKLKRGVHRFKVRAVNSAGVPDPTPSSFRWKVT